MRLLAILLLACLAGCAPKVGEERTVLFYDMHGKAYIVTMTIGHTVRAPALDRDATTNPAGGNEGDESTQ